MAFKAVKEVLTLWSEIKNRKHHESLLVSLDRELARVQERHTEAIGRVNEARKRVQGELAALEN